MDYRKGGYALIDCKKLNLLAQDKQTISGLYAAVKTAYENDKMTIAVNCEYGEGVKMTPIPVFMILEAGIFILTASILQVRVDEEDGVTITSLLIGG